MIKLDLQSRTPLYLQMEQQLIDLILLGKLQENDQLPSVRNLARDLGINPNTIQKAYQDLESRGIIYSAAGRGNFVASPNAAGLHKRRDCMTTLTTTLADAKLAGVPRTEIDRAVDEVYSGKEGNHD